MSYSIINADITDHKEVILSLWERNFAEIPEGRYQWIYENNPSGPPSCFLLRNDGNDSVVGAISLFPRTMYVNGKRIVAYFCGDFVVDTKHRAFGPALALLKAAISKCSGESNSILLGFPNDKSEAVTLRAGFEVLGSITRMTKVIKTESYIRKHIDSQFVSRALSYPLDSLLHLRDSLNCKGNYKYEIVTDFDERFDKFCESSKNMFSLKGETTGRHLKWRFKESPYNTFRIFTMVSEIGNHILGYVVFSIVEKRVNIADIAFSDNDSIPKMLIAAFSRYLRTQDIQSISINFAGNKLTEHFINNGYVLRPNDTKIVIYTPLFQKEIISEIRNGNWYLTSSDNDV